MSDEVSWRVELEIKPGQLDRFLLLTGEMVEFARTERGVLSYQRFVSDDARTIHVYERYKDSQAALMHLDNFRQHFANSFSGMVTRTRFMVYGVVPDDLKSALSELGATGYFRPFGGFAYWA